MNKSYPLLWRVPVIMVLVCAMLFSNAQAQTTTISGTVKDAASGEPLVGVSVAVVGTVFGTITDLDGNFSLSVNIGSGARLRISYIGYQPQVIDVADGNASITVSLEDIGVSANEVVISASRVEERIFEAPVTIEKMDIIAVQQTGSVNYYQGLQNLKGVDYATSSINFQILNTRGFNSTGNTQFIQLIDGMDSQAPGLNFPIGNLNGPSELDIESVELIPGASSALYGPAAFNGAILMNSKSPFLYQGVSAFVKVGVNHVDNVDRDAAPLYDFSLRYAKALPGDRFAFKINLSYSQAQDWQGTNLTDANPERANGLSFNPGYNGVHILGDEVSTNIADLRLSSAFLAGIEAQSPGASLYATVLPNDVVARRGYNEKDLLDYNTYNIKFNAAVHYRITDKIEAIGSYNGGFGTTTYTGLGRYGLKDFAINQFKIEFKGDNFYLRGYTTIEQSGDSYIGDFLGAGINSKWRDNSTWFGTYAGNYIAYIASSPEVAGRYAPGTPGSAISDVDRANAHNFARAAAEAGQPVAGSEQFNTYKSEVLKEIIPTGSTFNDETNLVHFQGQYDFKNQVKFIDLLGGAAYRIYNLKSNGTIFDDANRDISFYELGVYLQASKSILNDKLKLGGSLRYDKNENFDGQFNPRISGLFKITENHNIRGSYQTGFRFPTTQGQYINLNLISFQLIGGLQEFADRYLAVAGSGSNTYTVASADAAIRSNNTGDLVAYTHNEVKPERVQTFEVGYKGLIAENLFLDLSYYYNQYEDFISQTRVLVVSDAALGGAGVNALRSRSNLNQFQIYTNNPQQVSSQGAAFGLDYKIGKFSVSGNYNYNHLNEGDSEEQIIGYNTPEHKTNLSFGSRKLTEKVGFNITWRWQDTFRWESSFANGNVPAFNTIDAQISYRVPAVKSVIKLGGQNLLNHRYITNYGGPTLGGIYYVSITFDEFFN